MGKYIGIDIGTTNSLVAEVVVNNGRAEVKCLAGKNGETSFPSVVHYAKRDKCLFGTEAKEKLLTEPDATVSLVKTRLGKVSEIPVIINSEEYKISPQEISAMLLKQMALSFGEEITEAVVTKPANYSHSQNYALNEIAKIAQINIAEMIEEPSAAVMYHVYKEFRAGKIRVEYFAEPRIIVVFDFGGGTLDLSIVEIKADGESLSTKVIFNDGDTDLGGARIDLVFFKLAIQALCRNNSNNEFLISVREEFDYYYDSFLNEAPLRFRNSATLKQKKFIFALRQELERVKIELSSYGSATICMSGFNSVDITRGAFEKAVLQKFRDEDLTDKVSNVLKKAMVYIDKNRLKVWQFILVGGSSNIPYIQQMVIDALNEKRVGDERVIISDDYDTAIVKGAALIAAIRYEDIVPFSKKACKTIVSKRIELDNLGEIITVADVGDEYPFAEPKRCSIKIRNALSADIQLRFYEVAAAADGTESRKEVLSFNFFLPIYYTGDELIMSFSITQAGLYEIALHHSQSKDIIEYKQKVANELSNEQIEQAKQMLKEIRQ